MPLKDWPPREDWPPKGPHRSGHDELAQDEQLQAMIENGAPEAAGSLDTLSRRLEVLEQRLNKVENRPEQSAAQVTEAKAGIEALNRERAALEEFRNQLRESRREIQEIKQSVDHAAALRTELEQIRRVAAQLGEDYAKLRDASRQAREESAAATQGVQEVEKKLGGLGQLVNEIQTKFDAALRWRDEFVQETARAEKDGRALAADIGTHVERLALEKKQFEVIEQRMKSLIECERQLTYLPPRLDEFSTIFQALTEEADELRRKHARLDARASDLGEQVTALTARHAELSLKLDEGEQKMKVLADREALVTAVKQELDAVHQMSARSKADLQYLSEHREDLALLRSRLEELLSLTGAAEQKIRRIF